MAVTTPPEDRFAIQDLLARYAWTLDTGDYETYATLFTPDGVFVERGQPFRGRQALANHVRELAAVMRPGNRHHNTQLLFESGDAYRCVIRSYSSHIFEPEPGQPKVIRMQGALPRCRREDGRQLVFRRACVGTNGTPAASSSTGRPGARLNEAAFRGSLPRLQSVVRPLAPPRTIKRGTQRCPSLASPGALSV